MKTRRRNVQAKIVLAAALAASCWLGSLGTRAQGPDQNRVAPPSGTPWRPIVKDPKYVGRDTCAGCHETEARTQPATVMGRALEPAATSEVLRAHQRMSFSSPPYTYQIVRQGDQSIYQVTDGKSTFSEPILYAFGRGKAGQTYVLKHNGSFFESRLSFYKELQGLDWTMGYPPTPPPSIELAAGRAVSSDEVRDCFICHGTGVTGPLELDRVTPGVTCEACHGPGGDHVAAMKAGNLENKHIFNPANMSPDELSQEFCGSCHRSAEQVTVNSALRGIVSVRFQPYRSFTSRSHDPFDERLRCTACHNPHEDLRRDAGFYDSKCFACHLSNSTKPGSNSTKAGAPAAKAQTAKACPIAGQDCVSCHMPKVEVPGSHFKFTDHRIRIARPGEPFPN